MKPVAARTATGETPMKLTVPLAVILTAAFVVTPALAAKKSAHKHSAKSSCGTYMYMKDGKCMDARNKKTT